MSENYVYIDAPTLDNSDQSKILIDKELYFFDEPTSNLDKESEEKIMNLLIDKIHEEVLSGLYSSC